MKKTLGKSVLTLIVCCLAFGIAYTTVRQASGQSDTPDGSATAALPAAVTPGPSDTPADAETLVPEPSPTPDVSETPGPDASQWSIEEMGERAAEGSIFEKWGVRFQVPSGFGDFRVAYPVLVQWGPLDDAPAKHPNVIMVVHNVESHSSLFVTFEDMPDGPQPVEVSRHVVEPEGDNALDAIASGMEVAR